MTRTSASPLESFVSANPLGPKRTWTAEDWEEYRRLSWVSRRATDLMLLAPAMARWLVPLMIRFDDRRDRRRYEKSRRYAARERGAIPPRPRSDRRRP